MSLSRLFVLGALAHAKLLATWSVRAKSTTGGWGNPTTSKTANALVTFIHHPHGTSFAAHVRQSFQILVPPTSTNHLFSALDAANHGQHRAADNTRTDTLQSHETTA